MKKYEEPIMELIVINSISTMNVNSNEETDYGQIYDG